MNKWRKHDMKLRNLTISLTALTLASSLSASSAFAEGNPFNHGNHNNGNKNRFQQNQAYNNHGNYNNKYLNTNQRKQNYTNYGTHNNNKYNNTNQRNQPKNVMNNEMNFNDLGNFGWAKNAIQQLANRGIIKGTGNGQFNPGGNVTRAELSVLLSQYFGLTPTNQNQQDYADVQPSDWFYNQVEATKDYMTKFTNPNGGYAFNPNQSMNRAETAVTLVEILMKQGTLQLVSSDQADQILSQYQDANLIPSSLRVYVATAVQAHLMNGVSQNTFDPQGILNRAQIATLLYNLQGQVTSQPVNNDSTSGSTNEVPSSDTNTGTTNSGSTQDTTPPVVTNLTQTSSVAIGQNVYAQSNELGTIYLVPNNGTTLTTKAALDNLVNAGTATATSVTQVNSSIAIPTSNLSAGNYSIYAVDPYGNLSIASTGIQLVSNTINNVTIANTYTDANSNTHLNVQVTTAGVSDNTPVTVELVNQDGTPLNPIVTQAGTINSNNGTVDLALPSGLSKGTYSLKVTVGSSVNQSTTYTQQ